MQILSRHQLMAMEPEALEGTMECHGYEIDPERSLVSQIDEFDDFLELFRCLED